MHTNEKRNRTEPGWWAPAIMLVVLTAVEFTSAFALITKVSALTTSWHLTPGSYETVGR